MAGHIQKWMAAVCNDPKFGSADDVVGRDILDSMMFQATELMSAFTGGGTAYLASQQN